MYGNKHAHKLAYYNFNRIAIKKKLVLYVRMGTGFIFIVKIQLEKNRLIENRNISIDIKYVVVCM